ncbi:MAG: cation-translocating P-type ATPase [Anaerolineales bacterium]|jgi:Cd2+/Zn2+-exporting ATPase/Cu+-exporting ATPase
MVENLERTELHVKGMDCADCTRHVAKALRDVEGVHDAQVFLGSEKAIIDHAPIVNKKELERAIQNSGYQVAAAEEEDQVTKLRKRFLFLTTLVFVLVAAVLLIVVAGEWMGWFGQLSSAVPIPIYIAAILLGGWPVFQNVVTSIWRREIISHTLMTIGMIAAIAVGEWATAVVIVFFMRVGDAVEKWTAQGARRALRDLHALTPQTAWVIRQGVDIELPIEEVEIGDVVVIRPGGRVPVDGVVVKGQATIDQSAITGEPMPVEMEIGMRTFAGSLNRLGSLQLRVEAVGAGTTLGKVIQMVEQAEANQGRVQRFADRFSGYYLPIVLLVALVTFIIRRDPLAVAAVLVVVCSCAIALATPIAMLAAIGSAAKRGMLIKGGRYIELLQDIDVLLIDKTGTLTLGQPTITAIAPLKDVSVEELLSLAATVERYSEHPLAGAVTSEALARRVLIQEPEKFEVFPGRGAQAKVDGSLVRVGNRRLIDGASMVKVEDLDTDGGTTLFVERDGDLIGYLQASDKLRSDVPEAIQSLQSRGIRTIELLTGDRQATARSIASQLEIAYKAELLPGDKLNIVESYQSAGRRVAMVGDGINDAPALAKADVGIAMAAAGTEIAIEAAHIAIMRDDWSLVPGLFEISDRTMGVVRANLVFTGLYNLAGILLAALGFLPPIIAAAAQSLPDLGILLNSSRLIRADRRKSSLKAGR